MLRSLVVLAGVLGVLGSIAWAAEGTKPPSAAAVKASTGPAATTPKPDVSVCPTITAVPKAHGAKPTAPVGLAPTNEAALEKRLLELAPPPLPKACNAWYKRAVLRLSYSPAREMANALNQFFVADGGVLIVAEPVSNSLLISAVPGALEEVQRLAKELDRAPPMIRIDAAIVAVKLSADKEPAAGPSRPTIGKDDINAQLETLKKSGEVQVLSRLSLITLDNQPAYLQVGSREPVIKGTAMSSQGTVNSVTKENVGTILGVTPRATDDGRIVLHIDVERSQVGPSDEGAVLAAPAKGPATRLPRVEVSTVQTTVSMSDGETVRLGGLIAKAKDERTQLVFLVAPQLLKADKRTPIRSAR